MRKIIFSSAMSLDGFIADTQDGYAWIQGDGYTKLDTVKKWDYAAFLFTVDTVLMGRRCYELNQHKDFVDQKVLVATHQNMVDPSVTFIKDPVEVLTSLKEASGKNIFVYGGAQLFQSILQANLIDEMIIGIVPVLLKDGIRLFEHSADLQWALKEVIVEEGIVILTYHRRT
ncbi:MAG: RibD domain-containing protein [Erysipelotrichaceae bacterium]|nr:MAG: RibD domain-containing [Erysipelotrichaceae bacterium]TXT18395.1 MAG: RibD domain-containing protein [Erysipelotrichaceae bacterium]